jgi:chemotaxis methyl-accepting protein methylase
VQEFNLNFKATIDSDQFALDFECLFVSGRIVDKDLDRRIINLSRMFKTYVNRCPVPLWATGLALTDEICRITETYLEYYNIKMALLRLIGKSLRINCVPPPLLLSVEEWARFLDKLHILNETADPASLILRLAENENDRLRFLFSVYLPHQFGGSFGRYPRQLEFIRTWIESSEGNSKLPISCLDAACGSGEGSYELARMLLDCGVDSSRICISGVTISPLEVFAAAHAYFPQDLLRQLSYREFVESINRFGAMPNINFMACDLMSWEPSAMYRVIICNGILGGPLMHESKDVEAVIRRLSGCLHSGGIFLAADRFHGGWKKGITNLQMEELLRKCGLEVLSVSEGVAGVRS